MRTMSFPYILFALRLPRLYNLLCTARGLDSTCLSTHPLAQSFAVVWNTTAPTYPSDGFLGAHSDRLPTTGDTINTASRMVRVFWPSLPRWGAPSVVRSLSPCHGSRPAPLPSPRYRPTIFRWLGPACPFPVWGGAPAGLHLCSYGYVRTGMRVYDCYLARNPHHDPHLG